MNKSLIALSLFIIGQMHADTPFSSATQSLYKAIQTADRELFKSALIAGADVNAVDISTGYTPLMTVLTQVIPPTLSINDRKTAVGVAAIVAGIVSPFIILGTLHSLTEPSLNKSIPVTHELRNPPLIFGLVGAAIAIGAVVTTGFITGKLVHKGLKSYFVKHKEQALATYLDMIDQLLNHPSLNLNLVHDISGKTVLNAITDVLNPHFGTYTSTTYHHVGGSDFGISFPSTTTHVSVQFTVFNTPYSLSDYEYHQLIKPIFEKLFRFIYYQKLTNPA